MFPLFWTFAIMLIWALVGWEVLRRQLGMSRVDAWSVVVFGMACEILIAAGLVIYGVFA